MGILEIVRGTRKRRTQLAPTPPSNAKNVRLINFDLDAQDYMGFGSLIDTGNSDIKRYIFRAGTGHLTGGKIYYSNYTVSTDTWSAPVLLRTDAYNLEDCACAYLSNGKTIVFYTMSDNGFNGNGDNTEGAYFIIYNDDMTISSGPTDYIGGTSGVTALDRGWAFDRTAIRGWTPGEYYISLVQYDTDGTQFKQGILRTTDYWATFTYHEKFTSTSQSFSENICASDPNTPGRLISFSRVDMGGTWIVYSSTDYGATWTGRGPSEIGYVNYAVKIYSAYTYNDKLNIIYQDRDSGYIAISRDNDWDDFWGTWTFNPSTLIYDNRVGPASNYNGLGYPTMVAIASDVFLYVFCKETQAAVDGGSVGVASLWYSRDTFIRTVAPSAPASLDVLGAYSTSTSFIFDILGYTSTQKQNIDYYVMDVSTDPGFTSSVTAEYRNTGAYGPSLLHNVRLEGDRIYLSGLTTDTSYYVRIKAVNNVGESAWTSMSYGTGNAIVALWTEDIARNWVRVEFDNSIGTTAPDVSQFTITGKTVTEVVMRSDKLLYLKVNSDFAIGDTPTLSYTASGGLLGNLPTQTGIAIDNYITAATVRTWTDTNYYLDQYSDFNAAKGSASGDLWKIPAGTYGTFDIGQFTDQTFVCADDGDVEFTYMNVREAGLHVKLLGHPARVRSLKLGGSPGNFGIGCFTTGNITIEDFEITNVKQGIQVKTVADLLYAPYNLSREDYQNVIIRRGKINLTSEEAFYVGSDQPAELIPINWLIEDVELIDIGKDGVQVRNGGGEVRNITASAVTKPYAIGWDGNLSHAQLLNYGTTSTGCLFENCSADSVFGNGVFINGYGPVTLRNLNIASEQNTVYIVNYNDHDEFATGGVVVNFEGTNVFTCTRVTGDPRPLDVRRDDTKTTTIEVNVNADTSFVGGAIYVEDGVHGGVDKGVVYNEVP